MNKKQLTFLILCIVVLLWMSLIFNLSSQVREQSNQLSTGVTQVIVKTVKKVAPKSELDIKMFNHYVRKNAHFFAYFVLGILVMNAMRRKSIALLICIFYAISDEVHQMFVPGRGPQVKDVFIDSTGATIGILVCLVISKCSYKEPRIVKNVNFAEGRKCGEDGNPMQRVKLSKSRK